MTKFEAFKSGLCLRCNAWWGPERGGPKCNAITENCAVPSGVTKEMMLKEPRKQKKL